MEGELHGDTVRRGHFGPDGGVIRKRNVVHLERRIESDEGAGLERVLAKTGLELKIGVGVGDEAVWHRLAERVVPELGRELRVLEQPFNLIPALEREDGI